MTRPARSQSSASAEALRSAELARFAAMFVPDGSRASRARRRATRRRPFGLDRRHAILYGGFAIVLLIVALTLGPRMIRFTEGSPLPAPRSPLPVGSSHLVPGQSPLVQAVGGGVATPVTAPPPPPPARR